MLEIIITVLLVIALLLAIVEYKRFNELQKELKDQAKQIDNLRDYVFKIDSQNSNKHFVRDKHLEDLINHLGLEYKPEATESKPAHFVTKEVK